MDQTRRTHSTELLDVSIILTKLLDVSKNSSSREKLVLELRCLNHIEKMMRNNLKKIFQKVSVKCMAELFTMKASDSSLTRATHLLIHGWSNSFSTA